MPIIPVTAAATASFWPRPRSVGLGDEAARRRPLPDLREEMARRRPCLSWEGKAWVLSTPAKLAVGFGRVDCPAFPAATPHGHAATGPGFTPRRPKASLMGLPPPPGDKGFMYRRRGLARRVHAYPVKVCGTTHVTKKNMMLQIRYATDGVLRLRRWVKDSTSALRRIHAPALGNWHSGSGTCPRDGSKRSLAKYTPGGYIEGVVSEVVCPGRCPASPSQPFNPSTHRTLI